ncbi:MAG: hypothetical protein MHPSP_002341, partial [Paramarteilia canceri]
MQSFRILFVAIISLLRFLSADELETFRFHYSNDIINDRTPRKCPLGYNLTDDNSPNCSKCGRGVFGILYHMNIQHIH